jgi:hypothetical protein
MHYYIWYRYLFLSPEVSFENKIFNFGYQSSKHSVFTWERMWESVNTFRSQNWSASKYVWTHLSTTLTDWWLVDVFEVIDKKRLRGDISVHPSARPSVRLSVCCVWRSISNSVVCRVIMKFAIGVLFKTLSRKDEFRENRCREGNTFLQVFPSVVRQMPGYNSQRWCTARTYQFFYFYYVCSVLCNVCV